MPLYQTRCESCAYEIPIWRKVADRDNLPSCDACGGVIARLISAPYIAPDIQPYVSPATGRVINSRSAMAYDLEKSGHIVNEPGLKADVARWKAESDDKLFAPVAKGVDEAVTRLVNSGQIES